MSTQKRTRPTNHHGSKEAVEIVLRWAVDPLVDRTLIDKSLTRISKRSYDRHECEFLVFARERGLTLTSLHNVDRALNSYCIYKYNHSYSPASGRTLLAALHRRFP